MATPFSHDAPPKVRSISYIQPRALTIAILARHRLSPVRPLENYGQSHTCSLGLSQWRQDKRMTDSRQLDAKTHRSPRNHPFPRYLYGHEVSPEAILPWIGSRLDSWPP
eukprot:scaffold8374_cov573-Pinguiococcus_pyrenoidosus.AAC.1